MPVASPMPLSSTTQLHDSPVVNGHDCPPRGMLATCCHSNVAAVTPLGSPLQ